MGGTVKLNHSRVNEAQLGYAPSGASVVGQPFIVFDGKTLMDDPDNIWSSAGTGTETFTAPITDMAVASGEYLVRQSSRIMPYFAGYPAYTELTIDTFAPEDGVTKRAGNFSSSTTAPYTADLDGYWLESSEGTLYLKALNNGTVTARIPFRNWTGYKQLRDYDWDNFTVIMFDHLWLGGAALRLWVAHPTEGWVLAHTVPYVGNYQGTITHGPQNFIRYEIRAESGASGSMRAICNQYSVLGDVVFNAFNKVSVNSAAVSCGSTSSIYALQGIKLNAAHRHMGMQFSEMGSSTASVNDTGILMLLKNPTLSSALSYSTVGRVDIAFATNQTISDVGQIIDTAPSAQGSSSLLSGNYTSWATQSVDGTYDEFVVAFAPSTTNQNVKSTIKWKEFG